MATVAAPGPRRRTKKQAPPAAAPQAISREEYALFIGQIELLNIWLHEARVNNTHGSQTPDQATFRFSSDARWNPQEGGFRIFHHYHVHIEATDSPLAELEITLSLDFASKLPLTADLFAIFEEVNLPVNTWPYLREFVSTTIGRIGWIPFTIPALKQGIERPPRPATAARSRAARARQPQQAPE